MKLKDIESVLSRVRPFDAPKYQLEQYPTSPHIAARLLFIAQEKFDDITGRIVGDFGCGTAMLACGAGILEAAHVVGVDIDPDALAQAERNIENIDLAGTIELIRANVTCPMFGQTFAKRNGEEDTTSKYTPNVSARIEKDKEGEEEEEEEKEEEEENVVADSAVKLFDTIIMNPPFGTRVKGVDSVFLEKALSNCRRAVYSMHKSSTRVHMMKVGAACGALGTVVATLRFDIPKMYAFHKHSSVDVEVDLWRFVPGVSREMIDRATEKLITDTRREKKEKEKCARTSSGGKNKGKKGRSRGGGGASSRSNRRGRSRRR